MNDFRLNWQQPLPQLGELVRPEPAMTPAQRLRDERAEFEIQVHALPDGLVQAKHAPTVWFSAQNPPDSWVCHEIRGIERAPVAPSAPQGEWTDERPAAVGEYEVQGCLYVEPPVHPGYTFTRAIWDGRDWLRSTNGECITTVIRAHRRRLP